MSILFFNVYIFSSITVSALIHAEEDQEEEFCLEGLFNLDAEIEAVSNTIYNEYCSLDQLLLEAERDL